MNNQSQSAQEWEDNQLNQEDKNMEEKQKTIGQASQDYEPPKTLTIAELESVPVDMVIHEGSFDMTDKETGKIKTVNYEYILVGEQEYRVPVSVKKQLKVHLAEKPDLKKFKVKAEGTGINTAYTVVTL